MLAPDYSHGGFVTVGPDHSVCVFWWDGTSARRRILMRKSTDHGASFAPAVVVISLNQSSFSGDLGLNDGFRTDSFPRASVNPVSGHIYVAFNDSTAGGGADVFLVQSTDGGASWSLPIRVNDDATTHDQWQPALTVAPDGNHLFIGFYDRRLDPANYLIDTFGAIGTVSGSNITFGRNFLITTEAFPPVVGQDGGINPKYMGDYDQVVADQSFFYYTWADNRASNAFHLHQPDVRLAKIPISGSALPFLRVGSVPFGGVPVDLVPSDQNGEGSGPTFLTRVYSNNALVSVSAPHDVGQYAFRSGSGTGRTGTPTG
jgi:hypothetical protein